MKAITKARQEEYLRADKNKSLIGKRAKILEPKDYSSHLWNKEGIIIQHKESVWISLLFDNSYKYGYGNSCEMKSVFLREGSFILLDSEELK